MIISFIQTLWFVSFVVQLNLILHLEAFTEEEANTLEGHLQPLGHQGPLSDIPTIQGFPTAKDFYTNYVDKPKPVIFKGAAADHPAYKLWSDEYFLSFEKSEQLEVVVEAGKKEIRTRPADIVSFASYLRDYRAKDIYMVNSVPEFLKQDVILPRCIACSDITSGNLVEDMMWFSSGGTKSVLHTDYAENILCLLQGRKEFYLIDREYQDQANVTEQGFSDVDVDRVDLTRYPGLHNLEFHRGLLYPGDCIYIPWLWVHQVRSYERNIAVNLWWRHGLQVNFSSCSLPLNITIKNLEFIGFGALTDAQNKLVRNKITGAVKAAGNFSFEKLQTFVQDLGFFSADEWTNDMLEVVRKIFIKLDQPTGDNVVTVDDVTELHSKDWGEVRSLVNELEKILMAPPDEPVEEIPNDSEGQHLDTQTPPEENTDTHLHETIKTQNILNTRTVETEHSDDKQTPIDPVDTREAQHTEL